MSTPQEAYDHINPNGETFLAITKGNRNLAMMFERWYGTVANFREILVAETRVYTKATALEYYRGSNGSCPVATRVYQNLEVLATTFWNRTLQGMLPLIRTLAPKDRNDPDVDPQGKREYHGNIGGVNVRLRIFHSGIGEFALNLMQGEVVLFTFSGNYNTETHRGGSLPLTSVQHIRILAEQLMTGWEALTAEAQSRIFRIRLPPQAWPVKTQICGLMREGMMRVIQLWAPRKDSPDARNIVGVRMIHGSVGNFKVTVNMHRSGEFWFFLDCNDTSGKFVGRCEVSGTWTNGRVLHIQVTGYGQRDALRNAVHIFTELWGLLSLKEQRRIFQKV